MIININKPKNYTSFDIVAIVRKKLRQKRNQKKVKVGHAGTLDPLATGVLVVLTDEDTKNQDQIMHQTKEYVAKIAFGACTDTYDLETPLRVIKQNFTDNELKELDNQIRVFLPKYIGEISQTVPPYSAVKVAGKPLYKTSRQGKTDLDTLPVKKITIYDISIKEFKQQNIELNPQDAEDSQNTFLPTLTCAVTCSSGTYIRSLAHDLGQDLGIGGVLVDLVRTKVGKFDITGSFRIDDLDDVLS
jgi:tRNA pseudouridine55 synthase